MTTGPFPDAAALTAVYHAYRAPLVGYAHRLTGDVAAAHDVVQDVFVKLWERRDTLTVEASLKALLYTMTRNRALNDRRRRAHIASGVEPEGLAEREGTSPAPDAALQGEDLARHLRRGIEALPPRRAEAFTLSRFHGLSHEEIAGVMGLSVRTVDTHIVHALRDLRARLDALNVILPTAPPP